MKFQRQSDQKLPEGYELPVKSSAFDPKEWAKGFFDEETNKAFEKAEQDGYVWREDDWHDGVWGLTKPNSQDSLVALYPNEDDAEIGEGLGHYLFSSKKTASDDGWSSWEPNDTSTPEPVAPPKSSTDSQGIDWVENKIDGYVPEIKYVEESVVGNYGLTVQKENNGYGNEWYWRVADELGNVVDEGTGRNKNDARQQAVDSVKS